MLEEYRKHVAERAAEGIAPKPLDANQMAALVELLKNPPAGEEEFLLDLLTNRVPPGVDEAAYVKAGFLAAVAKGEAKSPLLTPEKAIELLGTMQGGYNIHPLIDALDDAKLAPIAAKALSHTLLMFDNFYDVEEKAKAGNEYAKQVMQSWADAEWFLNRPALAEKLTVTVFKVTGETNTDDLSPAPDAWSRPDIPLHALAMLKRFYRCLAATRKLLGRRTENRSCRRIGLKYLLPKLKRKLAETCMRSKQAMNPGLVIFPMPPVSLALATRSPSTAARSFMKTMATGWALPDLRRE